MNEAIESFIDYQNLQFLICEKLYNNLKVQIAFKVTL